MGAIGKDNMNKIHNSSRPAADENDTLIIISNDIRKNKNFTLNGDEFSVFKVDSIENPICKEIVDDEYNYSFKAEGNLTYAEGNGFLTKRFFLSGKFLVNDSIIENRTNIYLTIK